jgi:secondary thiamine-phosphate synthase enzyme
MDTITVKTSSRVQFVDITSYIRRIAEKSGLTDGIVLVYVPHTTAGITINEAADPDVVFDLNNKLSQLIPCEGMYRHAEGNSDAHIKASLMGSSAQIIVSDSKLVLGVWQGVFFCEFDGPRTRKVHVKSFLC